jgi:plasmid stabilization system protein ParE
VAGKVRHSASAETDLLEAWLYVAEDSIEAADRIIDQIDAEERTLLMQPKMGRACSIPGSILASCVRASPSSIQMPPSPQILLFSAHSVPPKPPSIHGVTMPKLPREKFDSSTTKSIQSRNLVRQRTQAVASPLAQPEMARNLPRHSGNSSH